MATSPDRPAAPSRSRRARNFGGQFASASAINNAGQVTGVAENSALEPEAFVWSLATGLVSIGRGESIAINDAGQVAGHSFPFAFLHTPGAGRIELGALNGDTRNIGFGINDAGHVVGRSFAELSVPEAFVYTSQSGMVALQPLLDPASGRGWSLGTAYDINNNGQIAGIGTFEGQQHAFLLTPTQCPAPKRLLARLGLR